MAKGSQNGLSFFPENHFPYKLFVVPNIKAIFLVLWWLRWGAEDRLSGSGASLLCASPHPPPLTPKAVPHRCFALGEPQGTSTVVLPSFSELTGWNGSPLCHISAKASMRAGWGDTRHDSKQWIRQNIILRYSISSWAVHTVILQ